MTTLDRKLGALKETARPAVAIQTDDAPMVVLFFSCTDGSRRAVVRTASAATFDEAWALGVARIREAICDDRGMMRWLRVDWVDAVRAIGWAEFEAQLPFVKRNYFRLGLTLDPGFHHAFLETELNANAMLYLGAGQPGAGVNKANFRRYARERHGLRTLDFPPDGDVWLFSTRAVFAGEDGLIHSIDGAGPNGGIREQEALTPETILAMVRSGSAYLARQVRDDGRFDYGWHPCFDRSIETYNSLRHASSLYAMIEAWGVAPDDGLRAAIDAGIGYLVDSFIKWSKLEDGTDVAWLIDEGNEVKLGGIAAAILALTKYEQVFGGRRHGALLGGLGAAILAMQDARTGRFDHVLTYPSLRLKQSFRVVYYDGEAVFALLRLFRATGEGRWLDAATRAMDHFIAEKRWREHDHWLAYCVDEMTQVRPLEKYFALGLRNVGDYLDFIEHRITAFPTLLELAAATERVIRRLQDHPACRHLLDSFDLDRFRGAMHARARYLANGHFWPELAMFYARPDRIVGSFFIRHHAFRVRIDDVEHFLSGLIAYRALGFDGSAAPAEQPQSGGWSMQEVAQSTGGAWVKPPPEGWTAGGLSIFAPSFRPGDMIVARGEGRFGIAAAQEAALAAPPAAVIVDEATIRDGTMPQLRVPDLPKAVLELGRHARSRFTGVVIGVTGSAGKTTAVAMLSHALRPWGEVGQTRFNANLPPGVAWNLACIDRASPHIVLEMAIGRMRQNAELARPDIALFTNILPAHLEYHRNTRTIAQRKARIFEGMRPGGVAILNREMLHWDEVRLAARSRGLRVLNYGEADDTDFQLLSYDQQRGVVTARLTGDRVEYTLGARGRHMAINSLAVLGVAVALGHNVEAMLPHLAAFDPVPGRGDVHHLDMNGARLTVLNDAYNANPGSMAASLELFGAMAGGRRKIAVLGEMLELGERALQYHTDLAPLIERSGIDQVHMLGDLYRGCWEGIAERYRGTFTHSIEQLKSALKDSLRDDDFVMIKGSHGSGLHMLLGWLQACR